MLYFRPERDEINLGDDTTNRIRARQHLVMLLLPDRTPLCLLHRIETAHPGQHHRQDAGDHGGRLYPGAGTAIVNSLYARPQAKDLISVAPQSA